jgi:hypothetical protein
VKFWSKIYWQNLQCKIDPLGVIRTAQKSHSVSGFANWILKNAKTQISLKAANQN